jgi:hypothetical protein
MVAQVTGGGGTARRAVNASVEPIVVAVQPSAPIVSWINGAWTGAATYKSGSVNSVALSTSPSIAGNLAFTDAKLVSTQVPELSATDGIGGLTITLAPQTVAASTATAGAGLTSHHQEVSTFTLSAPGLDGSAVMDVASFVVPSSAQGTTFPNLFVTIAGIRASSWVAWYQDFVINGNRSAGSEKTLTLELKSSPSAAPLATVKAYGVGIVALRATKATSTAHANMVAELYVNRMEITTGTGP